MVKRVDINDLWYKGYERSGLEMRAYEGLMKGTKYGSMITPGRWVESNLLAVITGGLRPRPGCLTIRGGCPSARG